jgi:hypothetical protein
MRLTKKIFLSLAIIGVAGGASAFSLLGPFDTWQVGGLAYDPGNTGADLGGPMNLGDEYRWNSQIITYAFDPSFVNYFGQKGIDEVNKAMAIFNSLPPMSTLSSNLTEFSLDTQRVNYEASALVLLDLKSTVMGCLMEQLGLTGPERYTWTLRARVPIAGTPDFQYTVIKRNFDPVTWSPTSFVNGTLYTYRIEDPLIINAQMFADAVEIPVDPLEIGYTSVASANAALWGGVLVLPGEFLTGFTRDDVGGLRYLYAGGKNKNGRRTNLNVENLIPGTTAPTGGSPFGAPGGGGVPAVPVDLAVRPGVDKIHFKQLKFDNGGFGFFITVTNTYKDTYMTNSHLVTQKVQRIMVGGPDILFAADDIGVAGGIPIAFARAVNFVNNSAANSSVVTAGPGQLNPPTVIVFNKVGPFLINQSPDLIDEANVAAVGFVWGSYDGTTNPPTVYPSGSSIQDLVQQVLNGGH